MNLLLRFWIRVKAVFRGRTIDREIDEELRLHLDLLAEEYERSGMTREEADRHARRRFGNTLLIRERGLDVRGAGILGDLIRDVGYAFRILRRNPWFTAVAVLTLAIAIGANTVIFTIVNSLLVRALPYPDADRLVVIWTTPPNHPEQKFPATGGAFVLLRNNSRLFESIGAARLYEAFTVAENADGAIWERVDAQWFTEEMASVLGVQPLLGRWPNSQDDTGQAFIVISHGLWQRKLGGARDVVGKKVLLDLGPATITGVMPPGFELLNPNAQIWIRQVAQGMLPRSPNRIFTAIGRLKPGVTIEQAQSELDSLAPKFAAEVPEVHAGWGLKAQSLQDVYVGRIRKPLLVFQGAVFFVLVIACANVAGLLLAQGLSRRRELAIRGAIGSNRWRIVRQLVVETVSLALIAGSVGLTFAWAGLSAFIRVGPPGFPRLNEISMDVQAFGFALLVSLATGLAFGALPAMQVSRPDLMDALRQSSRSATFGAQRQKLRSSFVVLQISLSVVLLIGSGLMLRSLLNLSMAQIGFTPRGLVTLQIPFPRSVYYQGAGNTPAGGLMVEFDSKLMRMTEAIRDRLKTVSGVESATAAITPPLGGMPRRVSFVREDTITAPSEREAWTAEWYPVTADYFETLRIPLIRGRTIGTGDVSSRRPVVVVNSMLAHQFFPKDDPIGRRIQLDLLDEQPREIIGIVEDVRQNRYDTTAQPQVYVPQDQLPRRMDLNIARQVLVKTFIVRISGEPPIDALRAAVREVDPSAAISDVRTVEDYAAAQLQDLRQYAALLTMFGTISALLCVIGIFSIVAHAVMQRRNEIGIRIALGAPAASVLRLVLRQGFTLIATGLAFGMSAAIVLMQVIRTFLWGIEPTDPVTFVIVSAALAALALVACYVPARRALKIDPIIALRIE
jgi:putative ABC transport system permease protein